MQSTCKPPPAFGLPSTDVPQGLCARNCTRPLIHARQGRNLYTRTRTRNNTLHGHTHSRATHSTHSPPREGFRTSVRAPRSPRTSCRRTGRHAKDCREVDTQATRGTRARAVADRGWSCGCSRVTGRRALRASLSARSQLAACGKGAWRGRRERTVTAVSEATVRLARGRDASSVCHHQ